jgi:hypothetical protein
MFATRSFAAFKGFSVLGAGLDLAQRLFMQILNDLHYVLTSVPHAASFITFLIISLVLCMKNA